MTRYRMETQTQAVEDNTLITLRELALMARKSYRTIMKWQSEGKLPPRAAVPGHPRYRLSDVEAWMKG